MPSDGSLDSVELKAILDAAGAMIIATDLEGIVQIFNPAAERLLGWSAADVVGKQTPALWHDAHEVAARAADLSQELGCTVSPGFDVFVAKARDQLNEQRQWTFLRKDGSRFPVQLVVSAIRDEAGEITGYLGTAQDLTARVEAEQERDRFFNVSLDMLGIANTDGYFKRINPTFCRVLGWSDEEFLSRPFLDFVHPADQAATVREVEKLAAGEPTLHFENRYRCKDGSWRWVAWTCTPQPDGTLHAAGRDVTELKQAEEDLRQTKQDLAITLNSIGDAVLATDAARRITRMNPVAEQLTGWSQSEALGRSIEDVFRIINEETRRPAIIPVDDVLATGIVHGLANHTVLIARDGTERPIADSAAPIRDDAGQITGVVLVFRDVAAERQFERELQQLNADLEGRVEERTTALAESSQRLENGSQILDMLASDATLHETLDVIARSVESEDPSALCSILLMDESGKHLLHGAAPSLPDFYNQAIHGIEIGECVGSCGTAAATKRRVIADDIQTHPGWTNFLSLADKAGLRSCWSEPIVTDAGQVLGTFAIYHCEPCKPNDNDIERIQWAANFARLAIERKKAQTKLVESERFNRATLDSLSAHVAVLDATGTIVTTNQAWKNFAMSNDTAWQAVSEGTNYLDICDQAAINGDTGAADAALAIRRAIAGEKDGWFHEYPCHAPREQRWFFCRVTRFPDNGAVHVVVSHENITAMKRAQEELSASLARYDSLARVSPVGIILFDTEGKCADANRRWCEMTGIQREEALRDGWHAAIYPEDRDRVIRQWITMLQDGLPLHSEHRLRPHNGDTTWVIGQAERITNSLGELTGYILTLTDVTDKKVTEQALRLISSDLAKLSGKAFHEAVAIHMAELVHCEITAICIPSDGDSDRLVTLALCEDGEIQPNLDYAVVGTPCADVLEQGICIVPRDTQRQYPDDAFLVDKHVEAYVGVGLIGSMGKQLGHLVAMSRHPLRHPERVESLLKLFSLSVVAEMERQVGERRFSDLFEFSPDAIVITNREGIILQANRQVATVFGWPLAELVGQPVEVLMPVNLLAGHPQLRERYLQSAMPRAMGSGRNDLLGLRKDGSVFPVDISLSPMQTPEGLLVAAAVRDVTERVKAERQIRLEATLSEFSATVGMSLAQKGTLRHILQQCAQAAVNFLDAAFARIWTLNEEEQVLELQASAGMYTHLDGPHSRVPVGRYKIGLIALEKQPHLSNDVCTDPRVSNQDWARKEGLIAFAGYPLLVEDRLVGVVAMFSRKSLGETTLNSLRSVSSAIAQYIDRKQAEVELSQLNLTLEQRVAQRTADLTAANEEIIRASRFKSEFLATMSHELRTPLNGILGMNTLLLTTELNDRQRQYVEACNSSGKVLVQLINDILDLSKIEAGKLELDPRECDIEAICYEVAEMMAHATQQKQLTLKVRVAPDASVMGLCDDTRLRQVLVNLFGNAIKFTSSGGITLAVDHVSEGDRTARLRFAVSDTGVGIPKDRLDRLFKSFSQVDSSTTRNFGGTGLGLSICKLLIELMGGVIGVESQVGVGSTFWFEIDIATTGSDVPAELKRRSLAGTRIIAIDGLDRERQQLADSLSNWHCLFEQVATVKEALAAVQTAAAAGTRVQVVLADCRLVTGDEFVELQKLTAIPKLFVIGLGSPLDDLSRNHFYGLGIRRVLPDPIRPSVLFNTLASVLSVNFDDAFQTDDQSAARQQPEEKLTGHILVAEDNRINQLYIIDLLTFFGCTSTLAANGEEALAAVEKEHFDVILMDCQMPEIDGFTASREIRKREAAGQLAGKRSIVALTANALKGDRERCLAAGMDEYVSKPVETQELRAALKKFLSPQSPPSSASGEDI